MSETPDYRLADLVDLKALQQLADANFALFGLPLSIVDSFDHSMLISAGWTDICVKFHRAVPASRKQCIGSDAISPAQLVDGKAFAYKCFNGLWHIAIPIVVAGRQIATLFLAQFFYDDEKIDYDFFERQAAQFGYDRNAYFKALAEVPVFPRQVAERRIAYDQELARVISLLAEKALCFIEAKEALANSEAQTRAMIEAFDGFIYVCSHDHRIEYMNSRLIERTGRDATGEPCHQVLHDLEAVCPWCVDETIQKGEAVRWEIQSPRDNRWYYVVNTPICRHDGTISKQALILDITDRKQLEADLLKAQKLESVGMLAGGIAHDFNNILTAVLGHLSIGKALATQDSVSRHIDQAEIAALRAKDLTRKLLVFSKGGLPVTRPLAIEKLVRNAADFALSGSSSSCSVIVPESLWSVSADESQIVQVIHNLVMNADQAMPSGGAVVIACENTVISEESVLPLLPGKYVRISVHDTGDGISADINDRIFDPFFTTKEPGRGLGLAVAYRIVKNHGGHIAAVSQSGSTTFTIYLPAAEQPIEKPAAPEPAAPHVSGRRILVMDDEEIVRQVVADLLHFLEYSATLVRDGSEAVAAYEKELAAGTPFDAVILDLTIPGGMGGREAVQLLRMLDPKLKAVVSSGYSTDPVMADHKRYGFDGIVSKPYRLDELKAELARIFQ